MITIKYCLLVSIANNPRRIDDLRELTKEVDQNDSVRVMRELCRDGFVILEISQPHMESTRSLARDIIDERIQRSRDHKDVNLARSLLIRT